MHNASQMLSVSRDWETKMTKPTKQQISETLIAVAGNISEAARRLGVGRTALHRRISKSPMLQRLIADQREALCDDAEACVASAVRGGDSKTAQWYLTSSAAGRARGYGKHDAVNADDDYALQPKIVEIVVSTREQVAEILEYEDYDTARQAAKKS